jgi:hypothetical protein
MYPSGIDQLKRTALLVLGMHRSGTSALSGLLVRLGAEPPRNLLPPMPDNPLGFWESAAFVEFHDRLLHWGGSSWNSWTSFNTGAAAYFSREWGLLLNQEFGSAPLFVVKDPRLCRLVPFWLQSLSDSQIVPAPVFIVRSPWEVAQSLSARNSFGVEQALLMWLRHVLDSELETRATRRCIVAYPQLLADWRAVADKIAGETGVGWPEQNRQTDAEISEFLRPELRHHIVGGGPAPVASRLAEWVQCVSAALDELIENGSYTQGPLRALDDVRREFDRNCDVFGPPFDQAARTASRSIAALEARQTRSDARIAALEAERDQVRALDAHLESERRRLEERALKLEVENKQRCEQAASLAIEAHDREAHLESERSRLEERALKLEVENKQRCEQAASLAIEAHYREAHVVTLEQEMGRLRQECEHVARELSQTTQGRQASEQCVRALLRSRSWRCTAPLRAVMAYLRRFSSRARRGSASVGTSVFD